VLFTMKLGLDSTLVAVRVDLAPGLDSEHVEVVAYHIKRSIVLDVTERPAGEARQSFAATGEGGGP